MLAGHVAALIIGVLVIVAGVAMIRHRVGFAHWLASGQPDNALGRAAASGSTPGLAIAMGVCMLCFGIILIAAGIFAH
ncbi:MAG TPA: hypothetical protein VHZ81_06760 [Galbitalea sp.]|jgi:hypothetical protein|nr:hypothetical protein [Galbitalea sp.]